MKSFATCLLVVGAVASIAYAYPARNDDSKSDPSSDAEFIVVPLEHQRPSYINRYPSSFEGFDGVLDTDDFAHAGGQSPVFFPSINPFTWQFSSYLDDVIKRVRDRFAGSWNPFYGGGDYIPSGPGLFPIDIPNVETADAEGGVTNSTSTVKVIDGHKVIINDTYYTKKTDFGTSVFKVRVIDVQPADGEESGEKDGGDKAATTTEKSLETGNRNGGTDADEAPKKDSDDEDKKEPTTAETPKRDTELDSSDEEASPAVDDSLNTIDDSKTKDIDGDKKDTELSVSSGIESLEGEILLAKLALSSPERSESLERNALNSELNEDSVEDSDDIISPDEWMQHQDDRKRILVGTRYPIRNHNQNQEDDGTSEPEVIDLTGDIAINEMLADKSIPLHPDVEVFAPNRRRPVQQDPMSSFPAMFPTFPQQPFPGVNRFPGIPFPGQFPQQFPQRPIGQYPVQTFPVYHPQQNPMFGGGQYPGGQQFPIQRPANVPIGGGAGGFGQQTPVLMMTFPSGFPAIFREVRP